eukprot:SAG22_NODE_3116_length_1927_cov_1.811816_3_plen_252_part_00
MSVGSTAYAWIHVNAENTATTLDTLAVAPFNKLRMTVFPKWYPYSHIEPQPRIYPYLPKKPFGECYICCNISNVCTGGTPDGTHCDVSGAAANEEWDFTKFDVRFWQGLDQSILAMQKMGIVAELILYHGYDHWGFSCMGMDHDKQYLRYLAARVGAYRNVWWSMANEWSGIHCKCGGRPAANETALSQPPSSAVLVSLVRLCAALIERSATIFVTCLNSRSFVFCRCFSCLPCISCRTNVPRLLATARTA